MRIISIQNIFKNDTIENENEYKYKYENAK